MDLYDIFFNICLGLFIGGLIFSIISVFLAHMESQSLGQEIDTEVDIDADVDVDVDIDVDVDVDVDIDADIDVDVDVDIDYDINGAEFDVDADVDVDLDAGVEIDSIEADVDVDAEVDVDVDTDIDIDSEVDMDADSIGSTTTPAPIMLLLSAFFLVFGITGMAFYFSFQSLRFIMFIGSPIIAFLASKYLNRLWKKIAKSQFYKILSTQNLIGKEGEVILPVDSRGGVIKIESKTPMRFEKVHVKPLDEYKSFERGEKVSIVSIKDDFLLVDNKKNKKY
ncbi:MAG: hypothetical protein ACFE85_06970 [Candidatus Hodarchaeota archaeon]